MASDLTSGASGLWFEAEDFYEWFSDRPSGYGRSVKRATDKGDDYEGARPPAWTKRSACLSPEGVEAHDEAFEKPGSKRSVDKAKAFCAECSVRELCLEDAMDREGDLAASNRYGVFGGLSPNERHNKYRRANQPSWGRSDRLYRENLQRWKDGARDRDALKARNRQLQRNRRARERRLEQKEAS